MTFEDSQAKEIIKIIRAAGKRGITKKAISRAIKNKGCDCENWITTLLEAGIIKKAGQYEGADLYRMKD